MSRHCALELTTWSTSRLAGRYHTNPCQPALIPTQSTHNLRCTRPQLRLHTAALDVFTHRRTPVATPVSVVVTVLMIFVFCANSMSTSHTFYLLSPWPPKLLDKNCPYSRHCNRTQTRPHTTCDLESLLQAQPAWSEHWAQSIETSMLSLRPLCSTHSRICRFMVSAFTLSRALQPSRRSASYIHTEAHNC